MPILFHSTISPLQNYRKAIEEWRTRNPDAAKGYTSDAWWEQEIYQKSRRNSAERDQAKEDVRQSERAQEIETIAKEWIKREYFRHSINNAGNALSQEDFEKQYWDRAIFEADLKYRQSKGEVQDPDAEWADFNKVQERKQVAMLKRAKEEMIDILKNEGLGGDELFEDDIPDTDPKKKDAPKQ
jgi:hypothetical protein